MWNSDDSEQIPPGQGRYFLRSSLIPPYDSPRYKDYSSSESEDDEDGVDYEENPSVKTTDAKTLTNNESDLDEVDNRSKHSKKNKIEVKKNKTKVKENRTEAKKNRSEVNENKTEVRERSNAIVRSSKYENDTKDCSDIKFVQESIPRVTCGSHSVSHSHILGSCAIALLIIVLSVLCYMIFPWINAVSEHNAEPDIPSRAERAEEFSKSMDAMKAEFPMQTKRFWKVIKAAVHSNLKVDNPLYPAIVLIASHKSNHIIVECLAKRIANISLKPYFSEGITEILAKNLSTFTTDGVAKLELDNRYRVGFANGVKISILKALEQSPGEIGLMLHSYCDNENAPFKDALFIFTTYVEGDCEVSEEAVEKALATSWRELKGDQYDAIWSRIGNNVAVVGQEDETVLNQC